MESKGEDDTNNYVCTLKFINLISEVIFLANTCPGASTRHVSGNV
jgi:hypothetical protein